MTDFPSYAYGTVSVDADGTVVTGTDTLWSGVNARAGDDITIAGHTVIVVDVTDETHLVIDAWPYDAVTAGTYKITQRSPLRFVGGVARADLTTLLSTLKAKGLMWYLPDGLTEPDDARPPLTADDGQVIQEASTGKTWVMQSGAWFFVGTYKAWGEPTEWDSGTEYVASSIVTKDGSSYLVKAAPPVGTAPPNATYYTLIVSKGDTGATGPIPLKPIEVWTTGTSYVAGPPASFVSEDGSAYQCLVSHTSGTFATDLAAGKWGIVASSGGADATFALTRSKPILSYGAVGTSDDSTVFAAALSDAATNRFDLLIPVGVTVTCEDIALPSNIRISGGGTIKRKASSASNTFLYAIGASNIRIEGVTIDGNKSNNTLGTNNISLISCGNYTIRQCRIIGAKAVGGGYGSGVAVTTSTDLSSNTQSVVDNNDFTDNDAMDIRFDRSSNFSANNNRITVADTGNGIIVGDLSGTTPFASPSCIGFSVSGNHIRGGVIGINIGAYTDQEGAFDCNNYECSANVISECSVYGLALAGSVAAINGNSVTLCGSDVTNGNVLLNGNEQSFVGNVIDSGYFYGIDAGGSIEAVIASNIISNNGGKDGNNGTGLNIGATFGAFVTGNKFKNNGGATGGAGISCPAIDGGGSYAAFKQLTARLRVTDNDIVPGNSAQGGIILQGFNYENFIVRNNTVHASSGGRNLAYVLQSTDLKVDGNDVVDSGVLFPLVASASVLVIPDAGDDFVVTGTTNINYVRTYTQNVYQDKVDHVAVTNGGSGYTGNVSITGTGGSGSGFAATGLVVGGVVRYIRVDNPGSGYLSAPTLVFSGGGGSGAAGTATIGCRNQFGRIIRLSFASGLTVVHGSAGEGTINLNGSNYIVGGGEVLTLRGTYNGAWVAIGKS